MLPAAPRFCMLLDSYYRNFDVMLQYGISCVTAIQSWLRRLVWHTYCWIPEVHKYLSWCGTKTAAGVCRYTHFQVPLAQQLMRDCSNYILVAILDYTQLPILYFAADTFSLLRQLHIMQRLNGYSLLHLT